MQQEVNRFYGPPKTKTDEYSSVLVNHAWKSEIATGLAAQFALPAGAGGNVRSGIKQPDDDGPWRGAQR